MNKFIHLISGPRNISTALMYSFASRPDFRVVDEPFYAYYLSTYKVDYHPGTVEILRSQKHIAKEVVTDLFAYIKDNNLFVKNMAHHLKGFDLSWMEQVQNVFLIRDVKRLINSFSKVIPNVALSDIGIKREWQLYQDLVKNGVKPIIVDANEILKNPSKILKEVCEKCDLDYSDQMLSWPKGPKEFDGVWASYWYSSVHRSTCFGQAYKNGVNVEPRYKELSHEAEFYYNQLFSKSITA